MDFVDLHVRFIPRPLCLSFENGECRPFLISKVGGAAISIAVVILLLRAVLVGKDQAKGSDPHARHSFQTQV